MRFSNPLSLKGSIGRTQLWLTLVVVGVLDVALLLVPEEHHRWVLSTLGGFGESYVDYATPIKPITTLSWVLFVISNLGSLVAAWVVLAALVQRLHDLHLSGKWVLAVIGSLTVSTTLEAIYSHPGQPLSGVDVVAMLLIVPAAFVGAGGILLGLFVRGYESQ